MPLDHFGNTRGTFKNRYWVNATYYKPGGPVFSTSFYENQSYRSLTLDLSSL